MAGPLTPQPPSLPDPALRIRHASGSSAVYIGAGLTTSLAAILARHIGPGGGRRAVAAIADAAVAHAIPPGCARVIFPLPSGETSKTRAEWARLTDALLEGGFGRDTTVLAVGGGVTGDLAGFVAATYRRGVPWVFVPTTLLAMLDAAVGGKTGVDTPHGKNLVGSFHPPVAIVMDPLHLATLPEAAYRSGMAEAVKHGLIADAAYFRWIEESSALLGRRDPGALAHLIHRSVEIKAEVVEDDERESGRRAILNAGHTVAHAIEAASGYGVDHGSAVAIGLVAECRAGEHLGVTRPGLADTVTALLSRLDLPTRPPALDSRAFTDALSQDKKNRAGAVHCAFPAELGRMHREAGRGWTREVPRELLLKVL